VTGDREQGTGVITENAVEARGLRKRFGDVTAVDGVDLEVRQAEVFGLLGPDGAGKTTLIRLLCGLLPPDEGSALVAGQDVVADPEAVKPYTGYLAQRFALYGDLTVQENVSFCADIFGVPRQAYRERLDHLLQITRLGPFVDRRAEHLSGGMRQKLGLMCALIHRPRVLFLDEPTTGVDPVSRRDFWRLLAGFAAEGVTILVSTPYMDEAERCDRVAFLHRGRFLALDTPAELRAGVAGSPFNIGATPRPQARRLLESLPEVLGVTVFGDRLHVTAREGTTSDALVAPLRAAGLNVLFVEPIEAGLEDVFTAAIGAHPRPGGEAGPVG
jgi:ABC-2 type transport system ATP-binding protein